MKGIIGKKVGMTQVYDDKGRMAPVTVLQVGPCPVLQVKAKGTKRHGADANGQGDGYDAIQIGFLDKVREKASRAERGHVAKDLESKRRRELTAAGVTPDFVQIGAYKGAQEMYANAAPSPEWDQNFNQLLDSLYANMTEHVRSGRGRVMNR